MSSRISKLKRVEVALLVAGGALVAIAVLTYVVGRVHSRGSIARFHAEVPQQPARVNGGLKTLTEVDYSLWDAKRVAEYKASLIERFDDPVALLRVDKIHLEVPVFEGTDERILNRGVGRIVGTAPVGEAGNIGIAGHRDGFFRGLKDVGVGDSLVLETADGVQTYVVDSIRLVDPSDVSVLASEPTPALTLVTCHPFYFIGSAPQRYIVHASLRGETRTQNEPAKASLQATATRTKENSQ